VASAGTIDIQDVIDAPPFSRFQRSVYPTANRAVGGSWARAVGGSWARAVGGSGSVFGWHRRRRTIAPVGAIHTA
jgi:hypothetical protein